MSTPVSSEPADEIGVDSTQTQAQTPSKTRRSRRKASAAADEKTGTENGAQVVYLTDADKLARQQGRIRTKSGSYLRPLTDRGNAERYLDAHSGDLVYVDDSGFWRRFNGQYWEDTVRDRDLHSRLNVVLRDIYAEAEQCRNTQDATEVRVHAKHSEKAATINAAKALLTSECAVRLADFDRRGGRDDVLNLANGTLNLRTFELEPHKASDMLALFSPVDYDPSATAPNWLAHLEWAIPDAGTRETLQRYFGYALTTETREQKMFAFYGSKGRNGKGVVLRAIEMVLGCDPHEANSDQHAYAQAAPASLLMASKRSPDAPSSDMARLVGKRFVSLQETGQGQKFDEVRLKALTGGDAIPARFMRQNFFQFTPVAKYVLVTNHRPEVHGDDPALWRRLLLVNFPNSISDAGMDDDPNYETRIQSELSGILNWMLDGLRKWRESGLQISDAIRADTAAYRAEQDIFGQFMAEYLVPTKGHLVKKRVAYGLYKQWCDDNGQNPAALRNFKQRLVAKVPELYAKSTGNPSEEYYGGIAIREGVDLFGIDRGKQQNPPERTDPGEPPAEHLAEWARRERAEHAAQQSDTEQESGTTAEAEAPEDGPDDDGNGGIPFDFPTDPPPDPHGPAELSADELDMLAELDAEDGAGFGIDTAIDTDTGPTETDADAGIDAAIDTPTDAETAAEASRFSARRWVPWTIKPSAYVDLSAAVGVCDGGTEFAVRRRGKLSTLAEVLSSIPDETKYVHLTGTLPGDGAASALDTWAHTRMPKGWTTAERAHDSDEVRDRVSLRYARPDGTQVTIYRAAGWIGDAEAQTGPRELAEAFALTTRGLGELFADVVTEDCAVPLKSTPASTGLELIRRTLPHDRRFPILGDPMQRLVRAVGGQARTEDYAARSHPSGGAYLPDTLPGLHVYDMRWCYAALFDLEMPIGPVIADETPEFARRTDETGKTKGWIPCLYQVRVTVPEDWTAPGRFRTRTGDSDVWTYPDTPGESFTAWAWEHSLMAADRDGWRLGEHVHIQRRFLFTGDRGKPLATFGRHIRTLREDWIARQTDAPAAVRELARIMVRQIAIAAIGKLSGTTYGKLRTAPIADADARPAGAWLSEDGKRWEWREHVAGRDYLLHPEWSSLIWSVAREWLYSHPKQPGVGLRHVPRAELVAARTDGYWTSTPQPVTDTGRIGHFRTQLAHTGELPTPRSTAEMNTLRKQLLAEAER